MKKLFYILTLCLVLMSAFATTSCTEEEVTPSSELSENGGGVGADDKNKP